MPTNSILNNDLDVAASPVRGGSGAFYPTIAAAIAGETEDAATTFAPQPGTVAGSIVGPGALDPNNDFYNDYWIVNESAVPSNGLQCRYARVADYVGASRTLIIDQPWDFVAETTIRLIRPIRVDLLQDRTESPTFTKNVEFNLEGHRLQGSVDQTAGTFCWIRGGSGWVTNGIQKTNIGVLRIDECSISRRDSTIYALLMTNGSDLGRTVLQDCHFFGVVAGRRGRAGWEIDGCRNDGAPETNRNIPYRLFESVAGVAVVVVQADVKVNSEWSGAVFYSENSLTGPAAAVSVRVDAKAPKPLTSSSTAEQPSYSYIYCGVSGATLTMTWAGGSTVSMTFGQNDFSGSVDAQGGLSLFVDFTGTFNVSGGNQRPFFVGVAGHLAHIQVIGTALMSGSVTLSSILPRYSAPGFDFTRVHLRSDVSGSISDGATLDVYDTNLVRLIVSTVTQDQPTASVVISSDSRAVDVGNFQSFGFGAVSAGTWTVSGSILIDGVGFLQLFANLGSGVSGGTFTISGGVAIGAIGTNQLVGSAFPTMLLASHAGTGGTLTISSDRVNLFGSQAGVVRLASATGAGASVTVSAPVNVHGIKVLAAVAAYTQVLASVAGATASLTGAVTYRDVAFASPLNLFDATVGGATVVAPSSITFEDCTFEAELTDAVGAGTITWAAATLRFRNCHVEGLFTFVGTRFSTVEAFETFFNGNSGNKSIAASGTRPANYRLWNCNSRALVNDLLPENVREWAVRPAAAALAQGQPVRIAGAGALATACAAASIVRGIVLVATGAANEPTVIVTDGEIFVTVNAAVVQNDNLVLQPGVPTQCIAGAFNPGQNVGAALEAAGTTVAGKAYSLVSVR